MLLQGYWTRSIESRVVIGVHSVCFGDQLYMMYILFIYFLVRGRQYGDNLTNRPTQTYQAWCADFFFFEKKKVSHAGFELRSSTGKDDALTVTPKAPSVHKWYNFAYLQWSKDHRHAGEARSR